MADTASRGNSWYRIRNADEVNSPSLLVYPDRIEQNIMKMISVAGNASRLWPHVKTHKMAEVVKMQMKFRIDKFKCATIAEAEMTAGCGAREVLLAHQPVGPDIERFFTLISEFPDVQFSCIADCSEVITQLSDASLKHNKTSHVWLDINNGMNRTGIDPGKGAEELFTMINESPGLRAEGLHVYDGHIHDHEYQQREKACNEAFTPVEMLEERLISITGISPKIVAGGTPTFPVHAKRAGVGTSPGTTLLWDWGYARSFRDLGFLNAAVLMTRIISKPGKGLICTDLGHKAVGSEMPQPRAWFPDLGEYEIISHNEEHMVIWCGKEPSLKPGDLLYAIPVHICPTVDRYDSVTVVEDGIATGQWEVSARKRKITI